jgi:hypothetical protein
LGLSNYPDGMDWGAYDDYHDPELECGHRANDGCDCWCEGGSGDGAHQVEHCSPHNCSLHYCECEEEKEPEQEYCISCMKELEADLNE